MLAIVYSITGLVHLLAAIFALITGTAILLMQKGSDRHIKIGYAYVISMLIVNITAFMIYRLSGGFGLFHIAALVSLITVLGGIVPAVLRNPKSSWIVIHFSFMYWSVLGLYAAFASELLTRIPEAPSYEIIGYVTGAIMFVGGSYFYWKKKQWAGKFSINT